MINNSTNINKTNNHLSPQLIDNNKRPRHLTLEIHVLVGDRHEEVTGLNGVNGITTPFLIAVKTRNVYCMNYNVSKQILYGLFSE